MKNAIGLLIALLAGLVLGSWALKGDLEKAKKEIAALRTEVEEAQTKAQKSGSAKKNNIGNIASILPFSGMDGSGHSAKRRAKPVKTATDATMAGASRSGKTTAAKPSKPSTPLPVQKPEEMEQLKAATDLWRVRVDLARNSFVSNAGLDNAQTARFDAVIGDMNRQMESSLQKWADELSNQDDPAPETVLRMINELSGIIIQTYDGLDRGMPGDWREKTGDDFQVLDFVNPEVFTPLMGLEDKLPLMGGGK